MFSRTKRRPRFSISSTLTRRWIRSRPGSVLILVIALLVLLALIGTAYLSSTQTERYTSVQNTINTEADLLIDGLKIAVNSNVSAGLFGSDGTYREPSQEMPTYPTDAAPVAAPTHSTYFGYDSATVDQSLIPATGAPGVDAPDLFLADRVPTAPTSTGVPTWNSISWPLFKGADGGYSFDSPLLTTSVRVGTGVYKGHIIAIPKSTTLPDGTVVPAMQLQLTNLIVLPDGTPMAAPPLMIAADADGDGIADSALFKLPIGPINGITYYAATRVIDNNSAINACTAWSSVSDFAVPTAAATIAFQDPIATVNQAINYGFFRSNIGLRELLWPSSPTTSSSANVSEEMNQLNAYRFNEVLPQRPPPSSPIVGSMDTAPVADDKIPATTTGSAQAPFDRGDFAWYSAGDALEQQLARRPGNPAYFTATASTPQKFGWLGTAQSAALAYKFAIRNPNTSESTIEKIFDSETYNYPKNRTAPYSASQIYAAGTGGTPDNAYNQTGYWYGDLFNFGSAVNPYMPLRSILTADNPVSNGISSRLGNSTSSGPPVWDVSGTTTYEFGDWVTRNGASYVCLLHHNSPAVDPAIQTYTSPEFWTPVPWTRQAVKTSINTATFNQLWLGFCHVMTDSISKTGAAGPTIPLWEPPMLTSGQQGNYMEKQQQMFRSVIRDNRSYPVTNMSNTGQPGANRVQLTPMQMVQVRAAIASINTLMMRNASSDQTTQRVLSHHITLADNVGAPAYDVEVFGTGIQPYIGQVYAVVDSVAANNFIAIQLLNPYPQAIYVNNGWGFATIDRSTTATTAALTLTNQVTAITSFMIPAADANGPGKITIYDGTVPAKFMLPVGTNAAVAESGLAQAVAQGLELVILKPRQYQPATGIATMSTGTGEDVFNEGTGGSPNLYDLVPVDQIDFTGANKLATLPSYLIYKRAAKPPAITAPPPPATNYSYAWNFVWPGFYTPYNPSNTATSGPTTSPPLGTTPGAQSHTVYPLSQAIVALTTEPDTGTLDFTILTGGGGDTGTNGGPPGLVNPTYNTLPIQLNNVGFPGPNPVGSVPKNLFPFGGFARNCDLLQVPFIGAYRICKYLTPPATGFFEMNSVTMDSSLANDSTLQPCDANSNSNPYSTIYKEKVLQSPAGYTTTNDPATVAPDASTDPFVEQIGRFCPVGDPNSTAPISQMDFGSGFDPGAVNTEKGYWHYHWAKRLFDYFTVQAPHDDYFPNNVDPALSSDSKVTPTIPPKYPGATDPANPNTSTVVPVNNSVTTSTAGYSANAPTYAQSGLGNSEDTTGVQGLININTAPWKVLAMLPFVPPGTDNITFTESTGAVTPAPTDPATAAPNAIDDNIEIAKAIVAYRNQNGPFQSIEDLYRVPAFRVENSFLMATDPKTVPPGTLPTLTPTPPIPSGDFSGGADTTAAIPTADGIRFDYEERFLLLNGISNLITTHSDTFTCYVLLQGWRNAGTANPTLAVQRRVAFLVDRTAVTRSIHRRPPSQFQAIKRRRGGGF